MDAKPRRRLGCFHCDNINASLLLYLLHTHTISTTPRPSTSISRLFRPTPKLQHQYETAIYHGRRQSFEARIMAPPHKRKSTDNLSSTPKRRRRELASEATSSPKQSLDVIEESASSGARPTNTQNLQLPPEYQDGQWPVKRLVDKRRRGRGIQYLAEWADHPITGEKYPPTWVSYTPL